ncbi:BCAM0308 family protein [Nitrosomonas sp.]|uniref:BCAM0308 family protein n=1 Tax=Nitrosomonas sp. TaxID=42353 RepID=UPI00262D621D|nr:BCAM0308 family protein [Nitrosomonas sp.]
MGTKSTPPGFRQITRRDGIFQEQVHDTYKIKGKLLEPTICPECNAVFHHGRWQWLKAPADAHQHNCPACQRILDHNPAGFLTLEGDFLYVHHDEIINLIHNIETKEKTEHPLKRIMAMEEENNTMLITTTDIHLARGIGEAIHDAYQGNLEFHYNPAENLLRAHWSH